MKEELAVHQDVPDHEVWGTDEDIGRPRSLRLQATDDLVRDGVISADDVAIYERVGRVIERRYRSLLGRVGYGAIDNRLALLTQWEELKTALKERWGDNSLSHIFRPNDDPRFCLTVYWLLREEVISAEGEGMDVQTLSDLLNLPPVSRDLHWRKRRLIREAEERARIAMAERAFKSLSYD